MTLKRDAKFKSKLIRGLKNDIKNLVNLKVKVLKFVKALKGLTTCTIICSFRPKYIMFQQEKFRAVMCHGSERWSKI